MPRVITMLGSNERPPTQQTQAGQLVWPGGIALITWLGLKVSGVSGSLLWLGPLLGAGVAYGMRKRTQGSGDIT